MTTLPFSSFPRKLDAAAKVMSQAEPRIVRKGGTTMEKAVTAAYRRRTGDGRLSGTKTKRRSSAAPVFAKLKDVRRDTDGKLVALIIPKGAYGLLERRIEQHFIDARQATDKGRKAAAARGRRQAIKQTGVEIAGVGGAAIGLVKYLAGRSQALKIPLGSGFAAHVDHPGTTPKPVFSPAARAAGPGVSDAMGTEALKVIRDGYRAER